MFLSDVAEFKRKRYEEYLRENKSEIYNALQNTREELSGYINQQRVNPSSKKPVIAAITPKKTKNTYRMLKEMGYGKTNANGVGYGLRQLTKTQERVTTPLSFSNISGENRLPNLAKLERGQALPELGSPLPELGKMRRSISLDNAAGKLDSNVLVNPVRNTFQSTEPRKPLTELVIPKSPKPDAKDTKKLLKNLGVAGVVSGGLLGAYGLHKYFQSKNKEK